MSTKRPPNRIETTPSGFEIAYWDEVGVDGEPQKRRYAYDDNTFPSASTIANIYAKHLLDWVEKETREGRDWRETRDEAAARGTAAHDALVALLSGGQVPNPADYPEEWRDYIRAGVNWFLEYEPEIIGGECIVASIRHGFAGRFDLIARFPSLMNRIGRVDYKTVTEWKYEKSGELKPPYEEAAAQVKLYEIAARESGYPASDFQAIVRLGPDGAFDMTETWATEENALGHVQAYKNLQDQKHRGQERRAKARRIVKAEAKQRKKQTAKALGQAA